MRQVALRSSIEHDNGHAWQPANGHRINPLQGSLPVLRGSNFILRELRVEDASSLQAMLATDDVARYISAPPVTVEGFERFVRWAQVERVAGRHVCFGVVPKGSKVAVGIFQLRSLDPAFQTAAWGFALGSSYWGTGIFAEGARMVIDFAVDVIGTLRLEARSALINGRGNGALCKIGAVREGVLRRSFVRNGVEHDEALWAILADEWLLQRLQRSDCRAAVN